MSSKYIFPILAIAFGIFIFYILYCVNTGTPIYFKKWVVALPYGDKIGHFSLVGVMTFFLNMALQIRTIRLGKWRVLLGSLIIFCFMTIEEFTQTQLSTRTFDLIDLLFNYLGILFFSGLAWILGKKIWKNHETS